MTYHSITEIADSLGCRPRDVSDLLYQRKIDPRHCMVKASRRLLPSTLLPAIEELLRSAGKLKSVLDEAAKSPLVAATRPR